MRKLAVALLVIALGVALWLSERPKAPQVSDLQVAPAEEGALAPPPVGVSAGTTAALGSLGTAAASGAVPLEEDEDEAGGVQLLPPNLGDVREEAAQNPHGTPPSLLAFAAMMGERMETALASESDAERFFPELESCVDDSAGSQAPQTRVVCLVNAGRLARRHPKLASRYDELSRKNPSIAQLVKMTGLSDVN